jgi:hypothetical protein
LRRASRWFEGLIPWFGVDVRSKTELDESERSRLDIWLEPDAVAIDDELLPPMISWRRERTLDRQEQRSVDSLGSRSIAAVRAQGSILSLARRSR